MKWLVSSLLVLCSISCTENPKKLPANIPAGTTSAADCTTCKTGAFKSYSHDNNMSYIIFRHDSVQKEVSDRDQMQSLHDLKWLSACTYQIKRKGDNNEEDKVGAITVEIYKVNGDTCFYKATAANPSLPIMTGYQVKTQ